MELDPIVVLAYVSVAVNIATLAAAAVAYLIFRVRRRRRSSARSPAASATERPFEPVFLKPYRPPGRGEGWPRVAPGAADDTP